MTSENRMFMSGFQTFGLKMSGSPCHWNRTSDNRTKVSSYQTLSEIRRVLQPSFPKAPKSGRPDFRHPLYNFILIFSTFWTNRIFYNIDPPLKFYFNANTVNVRSPDVRFGKPDEKASGFRISGYRASGSYSYIRLSDVYCTVTVRKPDFQFSDFWRVVPLLNHPDFG